MRDTTTLYEVKSNLALVYKKASFASDIVGKLPKGAQIEVLRFTNQWVCFIFNGTEAYIRKSSIKISTTTTTTTGNVTIKYLNVDNNSEITTSDIYNNLQLGTYTYKAKTISNYTANLPTSQSVTLDKNNPNQTITFYYSQILGDITVKYIDFDNDNEISTSDIYNNLPLGTYTYEAKDISNYTAISPTSQSVTLDENNSTQTITFYYSKILGNVTVKYIDIDNNNEIATSDTYSNLQLGTYTYEARVIDNYTVILPDLQSVTLTEAYPDKTITFNYKLNQNEVPYISTYYIKPIVSPDEEVIIDYYITDYYHKEYVNEDYSEIFTVTVRIEGKDDIIIENLQAGDHSVSLGTFPNLDGQEQKFSILCTDKCGRNSHELFNFFLVRNEVPVNEYIMTEEDLTTYSISNTNDTTMITSTREGLQKLLDDKQAAGYNRLKLLEGIYRIDYLGTIYIPTMFTLDMNGATLKLHEFAGDKALMMELNNTFDSHVINGTIEGDYYNHDYDNSSNNSEWVNGVIIGGECKYSSFENLTIKDITGYGAGNGISDSRDGKLGYTYIYPKGIGDTFKLGDIDRNTGLDIESTNRTTCDFMDISGYSDIGYLSVSVYLGYQGNPCGTWNLICHFYDENKNFIKSIDAYQYRRVYVPSNAKFMRVTILNEAYPTNLSIQLFRIPTHCSFNNINFDNCRCVGLAQSAMKDMLVESCEFTNCGQSSAKCAYDAEDGWDMMQDVTFRQLNFHDNPTNDFLTCAGHNFILEYSTCKIYIWGRTRNITIRNNEIKGNRIHNDGIVKTGVSKFINNLVTNQLTFANNNNDISYSIIRDCSLLSTIQNSIAYNCLFDIPSGYLQNVILDKCTIKNIGVYINNDVYINNCIFDNDSNKISSLNFNIASANREFNNCIFNGTTLLTGNYFGMGMFNNCNFNNANISANSSNRLNDLVFNYCTFSYSTNNFLSIKNNTTVVFNNCIIEDKSIDTEKVNSLVYLNKEPLSGQTVFKNSKIKKITGYVLDGYYSPGYTNKSASYEVVLNNSPVPINLLSDKYQNDNLKLYKVTII